LVRILFSFFFKSLKLKEVLGLISELKEQKNCSVVMILNEDELRDNKETLDKYKEKLIDYEFSYDPRPFESLEILQDKLTAFKDYPLQHYLTEHKVNNIRVISRIINANNITFQETGFAIEFMSITN
jgi:cytochrome oxidase Cu insertion factor (SCO1/SenC/PrrC family)